MNEMAAQGRQSWLDLAKGLGILFVMIGHTRMYVATTIVYFFHMPLFFFLSGYVFSGDKYSWKVFLGKKVKSLLIPYYVLGAVMLLCNTVQNLNYVHWNPNYLMRFSGEKEQIIHYLTQERYGTLWYIAALFWLNLILFGLIRLCRNNMKLVFVLTLAMLAIAFVYYQLGGGSLPGNIDICFTMMLFYFAGFMARKSGFFQKDRIQRRPLAWFILGAAVTVFVGGLNYVLSGTKVDIFYQVYGLAPLMYISSFAGTFAVICLCFRIKCRPLEWLGCNSLLFYAWHQVLIYPLVELLFAKWHLCQSWNLPDRMGLSLTCIIASLILLAIPTVILKQFRIGTLFGLKVNTGKGK